MSLLQWRALKDKTIEELTKDNEGMKTKLTEAENKLKLIEEAEAKKKESDINAYVETLISDSKIEAKDKDEMIAYIKNIVKDDPFNKETVEKDIMIRKLKASNLDDTETLEDGIKNEGEKTKLSDVGVNVSKEAVEAFEKKEKITIG